MLKTDRLFKELEKDLYLVEEEYRNWSIDYLKFHYPRYIKDLEIIREYYISGNILEIGAWPYHLTYILKRLGYPITAIDINPDKGKQFIKSNNLNIIKCDIEKEKIPIDNNKFDFIIFNEIFEHLRINPIFTLKEIHRILKPNGIMVLTTPNLYSILNILLFLLGKGIGINSIYDEFKKLDYLGYMGHIHIYSTKEVKQFLNNTGFDIINIRYEFYKYSYIKRKNYKINILAILPLINLFAFLIPSFWRPFQIFISKK